MIYIHEIIGVQPAALGAYVGQFRDELTPAMARHEARLVGLFQTWRTSELHAFWELDGHAGLDQLDKAEREDPALLRYQQQASACRTSFRTRTLSPTKFCPDLARLKAEGVKGQVYLLAVIPINAERLQEYLELFPQFGLKYEHRYGLKTVGYWNGGGGEPYQSTAFVCTQLCAGGDWAWWAGFSKRRAADPEVQAWMKRAAGYRQQHQTSWLIPAYLPY